MYSKQATVINATGIHARPASQFVDQAKKFNAGVTVRNTGNAAGGGVSLQAEGCCIDGCGSAFCLFAFLRAKTGFITEKKGNEKL